MLLDAECVKLLEQLALDPTKAAEISACLTPLTNYGKPAGKELLGDLDVDDVAQSIYPDDAEPGMIPVRIAGDGNCLYRAVSLVMYGTEKRHLELRLRCALELSQNAEYYALQLHSLAQEAKKSGKTKFCQQLT